MHNNRILLKQDKCLILQPELVQVIGRSPALLLQQIHYWLTSGQKFGKYHEGRRWVYNSYDDWVKEIKTISKSTINRSIAVLKKIGIIVVKKLSHHRGDRTNWYTINYDKISEILETKSTTVSTKNPQEESSHSALTQEVKMSLRSTQNESINIDSEITSEKLKNPIYSNQSQTQNESSKIPITQQMLSIWNQYINQDIEPRLTVKRARLLMAALKYKFSNDLHKWKLYCQDIASSDFLMGKVRAGFKASLDWALRFDIIQRICERQFGVKRCDHSCIEEINTKDVIAENTPHWEQQIRKVILNHLGLAPYISWFKDCHIAVQGKRMSFYLENAFKLSYIKGHFHQDLACLFREYCIDITLMTEVRTRHKLT
jgi:DNA-binding transcriptional regulator GbsR (MarR family)